MEVKDKLEQDETIYQAGKKAGIREVVEWISDNSTIYRDTELDYECTSFADQLLIDEDDWQAQLKTWFKDQPELLKLWGIKDE